MRVSVRLFAGLRERAGEDQIELELPDGAQRRGCARGAARLTDGVRVVMAVNREYADASTPLTTGDELALIPPVSGGGPVRPAVHTYGDHLRATVARVGDG